MRPALLAGAAVYMVCSMSLTAAHITESYRQFTDREALIAEQKSNGSDEIILPQYTIPSDPHIGMFGIYITDDDYWINKAVEWYYGVESVEYQ